MNSSIEKKVESSYNGCYKSYTLKILKKYFDKLTVEEIWNATINEYANLLNSLSISQENEDDALYFILPSVAIYKSLQKFSTQNALKIFREIYFQTGYDSHNFLVKEFKKNPDFLKNFPQDFLKTVGEGKNEIIFDTPEYTEFHIKKCLYVELTAKYNCSEICSVFCELDNVMYENLDPHLLFNRNKTIYNGDGFCNFSMRYINK